MKDTSRWILLATGAALAVLAVALFVRFGGERWFSGETGFVARTVPYAPHPYAFHRPIRWRDDVDDSSRRPGDASVLLLGPKMADGRFYTIMRIDVSPTVATQAEKPMPNVVNPYLSLDDLESRHLPWKTKIVSATTAIVDGRAARDIIYDYVNVARSGPGEEAGNSVNCRGRSVFFEDRGYYYILSYQAQDVEYDRYLDVFERMLASFHLLD